MRLVYKASGKAVTVGDTVYVDGEAYTVWHFDKPHKPSSQGLVFIRPISNEKGFSREFYVSVIGAEWIEREDRVAKKKTFNNGWGSKAVTRTEYQNSWLDQFSQMITLFIPEESAKYYEMQNTIYDLAGRAWDRQR